MRISLSGKNSSNSENNQKVFRPKNSSLKDVINEKEAHSLELAMDKGSSCWLNALPMKSYHFVNNHGEI